MPDIDFSSVKEGHDAIQSLGDNLPAVAAAHRMSAQEFKRVLTDDRTARVDRKGRLHFVETELPGPEAAGTVSDTSLAGVGSIP